MFKNLILKIVYIFIAKRDQNWNPSKKNIEIKFDDTLFYNSKKCSDKIVSEKLMRHANHFFVQTCKGVLDTFARKNKKKKTGNNYSRVHRKRNAAQYL